MKTIATIKEQDGQLIIELRDEHGTLIDMFPVDVVEGYPRGPGMESNI